MSKGRSKTFEEKQRSLTDAEKEALMHLKEKKAGVKKKTKAIDPEKIKLQDVVGSPEVPGKNAYYEEGKLITPETLEEERKAEIAEKKRYIAEFDRQFKEWCKEDHHSEYQGWCDFDHNDYLVRIFKMDVSEFKNFVSLEYEWSPIKQNYKLKDVPMTENTFPIVKILAVGEGVKSDKYQVGDVCLVPSTDIIGEDWNPKFLHIMQFQDSKGMKPKIPKGMRQTIPNVEVNWERYKFVRPWLPEPEEKDHLTYLIPEAKIRGRYKK